jgi:predicted metallo-beta-lactamase superfamily hydrolase
MGAKSTCTLVSTPDISLAIDPGITILQPSFPASSKQKIRCLEKGKRTIKQLCKNVDAITISHYHYDHYFPEDLDFYQGKKVFIKNPNEYINNSQRIRAEELLRGLIDKFHIPEKDKSTYLSKKKWPDPLDDLPLAREKDFGEYNSRRKEVLDKGYNRFVKQTKKWKHYMCLPEFENPEITLRFPEGKTFEFGRTKLKFSNPFFHGIEYAGVGWVFATIVEYNKKKLLHSSDISGRILLMKNQLF